MAAVEKAEAQKIQVVKAAEADAEAKFLAGQVGHIVQGTLSAAMCLLTC